MLLSSHILIEMSIVHVALDVLPLDQRLDALLYLRRLRLELRAQDFDCFLHKFLVL